MAKKAKKAKSAKKAKKTRKRKVAKPVRRASPSKARKAAKKVAKKVKARRAAPRKAAKPAPAAAPKRAAGPRIVEGGPLHVAGLGGRFTRETAAGIKDLWMRFGPSYFGRVPGQVGMKAYGVCTNMDGQGGLDYLCAVEVDSPLGVPAELAQMRIEPHRYAVFPHADHISKIGDTWMAIFADGLRAAGLEMADAPSFELYGEKFDPEVAIGEVEIWIPVKG